MFACRCANRARWPAIKSPEIHYRPEMADLRVGWIQSRVRAPHWSVSLRRCPIFGVETSDPSQIGEKGRRNSCRLPQTSSFRPSQYLYQVWQRARQFSIGSVSAIAIQGYFNRFTVMSLLPCICLFPLRPCILGTSPWQLSCHRTVAERDGNWIIFRNRCWFIKVLAATVWNFRFKTISCSEQLMQLTVTRNITLSLNYFTYFRNISQKYNVLYEGLLLHGIKLTICHSNMSTNEYLFCIDLVWLRFRIWWLKGDQILLINIDIFVWGSTSYLKVHLRRKSRNK